MAKYNLFGSNKTQYSDPGTGTSYSFNSKRIINKDGSFNVTKSGLGYNFRNTFQFLIGISWTRFLIIIFAFLFAINAVFAVFYTIIGVDSIGVPVQPSILDNFLNAYFFSFQTFTTVGYGGMSPIGKLTNIIAALEAIIGWMCFAIVTGILYGRFSKPSALLKFSAKALIAPYKDNLNSLQFRIANMRMSNLMEMEATVLLMIVERDESGESILKRNFIPIELERSSILFFPLNWTVVHPITKESPLYGKTHKEMEEMDAEVLIMIKGFDDTFSNVVHSRHSYKCEEIEWGAKFKAAYETQDDGEIMLFFNKIDDYEKAELNEIKS